MSVDPGSIITPTGNELIELTITTGRGSATSHGKVYATVGAMVGAMYRPLPFQSRIVYAGDEITACADAVSSVVGGYAQSSFYGYKTWAQMLSNQYCYAPYGSNAGVASTTSTMLLARYDTDVIALKPKVVVLMVGTYDVLLTTTGAAASVIAQYKTNLDAMLNKNAVIGATTILIKVIPYGLSSPMSTDQVAVWEGINAYMASKASSSVIVLDSEIFIGAHTAAHGASTGCYQSDYLHPNLNGAMIIGSMVARAIVSLVSPGNYIDSLQTNPALTYYFPGPTVTGTVPGSGQIAGGWSNFFMGNTILNVWWGLVSGADGLGQQQMIYTSGNAFTAGTGTALYFNKNYAGVLNVGEKWQIVAEMSTAMSLTMPNNRVGAIGPWVTDSTTGATFGIGYSSLDQYAQFPNCNCSGVFASPIFVLPNSFAASVFFVGCLTGHAGGANGSFGFKRVALIKHS